MNTFLILIEIIFFHGLAIYTIVKKNERGIFYLPVVFFVDRIIDTPNPAVLFYGLITILILVCAVKNGFFFRNNIWSLLLIVYFLILLNKSSDLTLIRPYVFSVCWMFLLIALIPNIYRKFPAEVVRKELSSACLL